MTEKYAFGYNILLSTDISVKITITTQNIELPSNTTTTAAFIWNTTFRNANIYTPTMLKNTITYVYNNQHYNISTSGSNHDSSNSNVTVISHVTNVKFWHSPILSRNESAGII